MSEGGGAAFSELDGVAVDGKGEVWVAEHERIVFSFNDALANEFTGRHEAPLSSPFWDPGFAVDSEDDLYPVHEVQGSSPLEFRLSKLLSGGEVVSEAMDEEESSGVAVDLSGDDVYVDNVGSVGRFSSAGVFVERFGEGVLTGGGGVGVDAGSGRVYVAETSADRVMVFGLEEPRAPTVEAESVSDVSGEAATFEGSVNPRGAVTDARFEYGRCVSPSGCAGSGFEKSVSVGVVGSGFVVATIGPVHVQGLSPGTAYHYRVLVSSGLGTTVKEGTFTTEAAGGQLVLPDGREWELVSPAHKRGALILWPGEEGAIQAAVGGGAISYFTDAPTESEPPGYAVSEQLLSTRGPEGWRTQDISPAHHIATDIEVNVGLEFRLFSENLSVGVVQPFGAFVSAMEPGALAPGEASEQTAFLRLSYVASGSGEGCVSGCYRPLVSGETGFANVPANAVFGQVGKKGRACPPEFICGPEFTGATADLSRVVLASNVALTSTPTEGATSLYEWDGGKPLGEQLSLVSLLPAQEGGGPATTGATFGNSSSTDAQGAISDDGSRVFWSTPTRLYVRDVVRAETLAVDGPEAGCGGCEAGGGVFQAASTDGSRVFFTDTRKLTANSGASAQGSDLYECVIVEVAGRLACQLSDLTPAQGGEAVRVQGKVVGVSRDGSWVYFVADGVLAAGAVKGDCVQFSPAGASCDLYVWHEGAIGLVGVVAGEDSPDWTNGGQIGRVSPDGRWLAFMSLRDLTGYDTRDALTGQPDEELYLYHGEAEAGEGGLVCASCDPSGAHPVGVVYGPKGANFGIVRGTPGTWTASQGLAADVPGWSEYEVGKARYQPRYLSDSGRLFFNSPVGLVPQDGNGTWDVYEYEPAGVGDCSTGLVTFSERSDGCVGLISSGSSVQESVFLDASESGSDVFFLTTARLVPEDFDTALDVYDAHECSPASPCLQPGAERPPVCVTEASCRPAPTPQPSIFGAPSSATFSGIGNVLGGPVPVMKVKVLTRAQKLAGALRVCRAKHDRGKRVVCERVARKRYGPAGKASAKARREVRGRSSGRRAGGGR